MMPMRKQNEETVLRRYLLGETAGEERSTIEQRLLIDGEYFNSLLKMEEQLIDEYAAGRLGAGDRKSFERFFLADPERRKKIEFAKTLNQYVKKHTGGRSGGRFSAWLALHWRNTLSVSAAAALVFLALSVALLIRAGRLQDQLKQAQAQREQAEQQEKQHSARLEELAQASERQQQALNSLEQQIAGARGPASEIAAVSITPGLARSTGQTAVAELSPHARQLVIKLQLGDGNYKTYQAEIQTVEGDVIFNRRLLHPSGSPAAVTLQVPATLLTRSDYLVALRGVTADAAVEKAGTYYFKVVRK